MKKYFLLFLLIGLTGCASLTGVTYFDLTTYKNLTELKPQILFLYEDFKEEPIPKNEIRAIKLRLAQSYEYELGKGSENDPTVKQFEKIKNLFSRHVLLRLNSNKWSNAAFESATENITEAFDIAIQTETTKNNFK